MHAMPSSAAATRSSTAPAAPPLRRLVLVPSDSPRSQAGVRRFRLAQRRLEGRAAADSERLARLRRSYD